MPPILASAPTRIDLAGGTLDIWPLYLLLPDCVTVNLAIDRRARVRIAARRDDRRVLRSLDTGETAELADDGASLPLLRAVARSVSAVKGYTLTTRAAVPPGSGLGGSSSMAVAALRGLSAFGGRPMPLPRVLAVARDLEAKVIRVPTGNQDHIAAARGGLAAVHFRSGGFRREPIRADLRELGSRIALVLVGQSRLSADTNWRMLRAAVDGDAGTLARFAEIAAAARAMREALLAGDLCAAASAMEREYGARRGLVPGVETPEMARVHAAALAAGALAGKVCGAGGGGGMVFLVPPGRRSAVLRAAEEAGARPLPFRPDPRGVEP
jgi:D-glycero-alpha-D-manno-heptose-7-phosphate kinase